ncbi:RNA pseudouridylate synthase domain-containing protein 4 [Trichinella britovi]|uniref:Pseudouridylate synthase RPUSD4, mitochondrial n=1 Tax=Trichinella britovi TaxID=45882 RepID=A0A0V1DBS7_TRIBR|nr:RNA pseudouridylate synthase domain-containing protein 4 [Trichinella britovi]KRZ94877.1 RNA pseudouridylate synthase domain-containing protein 4 [Trichinella sp. T8]
MSQQQYRYESSHVTLHSDTDNDDEDEEFSAYVLPNSYSGGKSTYKLAQKIRNKLEAESVDKELDLDGSLRSLNKIYSLMPDLNRLPKDEVAQLCAESVLYNKNDLIVLNKPYGLAVTNGAGIFVSLKSILPILKELISPKSEILRPVHRLDRCTTGVLMLASSKFRFLELKDMFKREEIKKTYICITKLVPDPSSGVIEAALGERRISGRFKTSPLSINLKGKEKYLKSDADAKIVKTEYSTLSVGEKCALIKCSTYTGMKHQIRCHMGLCFGHPIVGDHKYSDFVGNRPQRLPSEMLHKLGIRSSKSRHLPLYLHASEIEIPEFPKQKNLSVRAPLPNFFLYTLKRLRLRV